MKKTVGFEVKSKQKKGSFRGLSPINFRYIASRTGYGVLSGNVLDYAMKETRRNLSLRDYSYSDWNGQGSFYKIVAE